MSRRFSRAPDDDEYPLPTLDRLNDTLIDHVQNRAKFLTLAQIDSANQKSARRDQFHFIMLASAGLLIGEFPAMNFFMAEGLDSAEVIQLGIGGIGMAAGIMGVLAKQMEFTFAKNDITRTKMAQKFDLMIYDLTHAHPNFKGVKMHLFDDTPRLYTQHRRTATSFEKILGL